MNNNIQQILKLVSENPDLKGSFFEELLLTLQSGEFSELTKKINPETEKSIGEMNSLEKALQTLCDKYMDREQSMKKQLHQIVFSVDDVNDIEAKEKQIMNELRKNASYFKVVNQLLFSSIFNRFAHLVNSDNRGFDLRSGYQIILLNKDDYGDSVDMDEIMVMNALSEFESESESEFESEFESKSKSEKYH